MAKLRSYNEQFLIAASLIASVLNDVVIERRRHSQNRDYSKPINIKDILQKNIQVPCIFGDRSIILKSLQNHQGAVKLPLFVLQSSGIKTDEIRIADLHVDMIYQRDQQFTRLAKDHPLYSPYDLRRRRPLPITIDYQLTMLAKYKEDLDQMMTNWMVHCRPDLYVKWWHPRDKTLPLESEILWSQNISYKKPEEQPTSKFQYQATTSFTFKTWVFPGLDYKEDEYNTEEDGIIKYFNWFPTDINSSDVDGTEGYPTLGSIGGTPAGFFAVPNNMEFENDGSDEKGIQLGKYYINNLTQTPSSLYNGDNGIKDIEATADILTKDTYEKMPTWNEFQDACQFDNISNERAGIKAVYFSGAYPASAMNNPQNPSGDFLFHYFVQDSARYDQKIVDIYDKLDDAQFGICFTQSIHPKIKYNFNQKSLYIVASLKDYIYEYKYKYIFTLESYISHEKIIESLELINIPQYSNNHDIKLKFTKELNEKFQYQANKYKDYTINIKLLNNTKFKGNSDSVMFTCQTHHQQEKLTTFKKCIEKYWEKMEISPADDKGEKCNEKDIQIHNFRHYKLICNSKEFRKIISKYAIYENFIMFPIREEFTINNNEYTLIANNYMYFVLSDEGIYDWNVIHLPRFISNHYPVFKTTIKNGQLIYGLGMDCHLASAIRT